MILKHVMMLVWLNEAKCEVEDFFYICVFRILDILPLYELYCDAAFSNLIRRVNFNFKIKT